MSEVLSPSPYAYLDDLPPLERQKAISMRQHRANADSGSAVDLARRARDYQARIAELEEALTPFGRAADNFDKMPVKDPEGWFVYSGSQSHDRVEGAISVGDIRRARNALRRRT